MNDLDNQIRIWTAGLGMPWEGFLRLGLAGLASGVIGLERELRGRSAGLRTNILMSVGAALAIMVSISFAQRDWPHSPEFNVTLDPARVAYGVMTGIGLLCAGVIVKNGDSVHGMTTSASLWCSTALGLASGMGLYLLTIGTAVLILGVLWILELAEERLPRLTYVWLTISRKWTPQCVSETVSAISAMGLPVVEVCFNRSMTDATARIRVRIGLHRRRRFYELAEKIEKDPSMELVAGDHL